MRLKFYGQMLLSVNLLPYFSRLERAIAYGNVAKKLSKDIIEILLGKSTILIRAHTLSRSDHNTGLPCPPTPSGPVEIALVTSVRSTLLNQALEHPHQTPYNMIVLPIPLFLLAKHPSMKAQPSLRNAAKSRQTLKLKPIFLGN